MNARLEAAVTCTPLKKPGAIFKPSPPSMLGGEDWVQGRRLAPRKRRGSAGCRPLTPTLSPIMETMGERENCARHVVRVAA
jgi:hypothetical protein